MTVTVATDGEFVVLLDEAGRAIGRADKAAVHHRDTPLHLGFSCYLFNDDGHVLLTRRALNKHTWPGVWTNSFCGHPAPQEDLFEAVARRARQELGVSIDSTHCVLPDFRYRAVAPDGTVENEFCPVFWARANGAVAPVAHETMDARWVPWHEMRAAADLAWVISPWAAEQVPLLERAGLPRQVR